LQQELEDTVEPVSMLRIALADYWPSFQTGLNPKAELDTSPCHVYIYVFLKQ